MRRGTRTRARVKNAPSDPVCPSCAMIGVDTRERRPDTSFRAVTHNAPSAPGRGTANPGRCVDASLRMRRKGRDSTSTRKTLVCDPYPSKVKNMAKTENGEEPPLVPLVAWQEINIGRVVGQGGFSVVSEVQGVKLNEVNDTSEEEAARRRQFASTCREDDPHNLYVIKVLRTDLSEEEHTKGIVDLAIEANFLETLSHPNIIAMQAMANSDPYENRFFVVLDRLVMTLERKMNFWRKEVGENTGFWMGPCFGYCCAKKPALYRLWTERIMVTRDIANGIQYMHSQDIVYRDLKPDNVGFNAEGEVKIFDFGLGKRLDPMEKTDDGLYRMTGNTGSLRYMAPEVANCEPYDRRVDAYSFGILFWQICSLTTPYAGFSTKMHAEKVLRQGHRPKPDATWPLTWVDLMKACWATDICARPEFNHIVNIMQGEVDQLVHEEGVVPTRATDIRAKKRKAKAKRGESRLDLDTRITAKEDKSVKRFDVNVV